jgi:integrase
MLGMEKPWDKGKPRDRVWFKKVAADEAIRKLWRCAAEIGGIQERYIKLILLLGKRKSALANMRWEEIDEKWFWDAPPSDATNKRLRGMPLPTLAQRILHPRRAKGLVFEGINPDKLMKEVRERADMPDFFWHGVRHMLETKTAELRDHDERPLILPHIRDLLFDHSTQRGTGKDYDHHDYKPEMRTALEQWAAYVDSLTTPKGVARLR